MKKSLMASLLFAALLGVSSGVCLAQDGNGLQAYAEAERSKPVVYDRDYPQLGFRSHSWITGSGSETIAHTQLIDRTNGTVIKEVNRRCSYVDPIWDYSSN